MDTIGVKTEDGSEKIYNLTRFQKKKWWKTFKSVPSDTCLRNLEAVYTVILKICDPVLKYQVCNSGTTKVLTISRTPGDS